MKRKVDLFAVSPGAANALNFALAKPHCEIGKIAVSCGCGARTLAKALAAAAAGAGAGGFNQIRGPDHLPRNAHPAINHRHRSAFLRGHDLQAVNARALAVAAAAAKQRLVNFCASNAAKCATNGTADRPTQ